MATLRWSPYGALAPRAGRGLTKLTMANILGTLTRSKSRTIVPNTISIRGIATRARNAAARRGSQIGLADRIATHGRILTV